MTHPAALTRARLAAAAAADPDGPTSGDHHVTHPGRRARPGLAVVALAVAWLASGPRAAVVLGVGAAAWAVQARVRTRQQARRHRAAQLPAALDRLSTALRSGASLPSALAEAASATPPPVGDELAGLAQAADRGRPLVAVLDEWSSRKGDPGTRLAATALVLATLVGSAPARAVDGVTATLRERLDLAAERRALATQARTSALVLAIAPLAFTVVLVAGDDAAAGFLLGRPAGWACLAAGAGLDAAGAWWMARLTRGDDP